MCQCEYLALVMFVMLQHYHIWLQVKTINVGLLFFVPCFYVFKYKNTMVGYLFYQLHKELFVIPGFIGIEKLSCTHGN